MVSGIELTNLLRHPRNWLAGTHPKSGKKINGCLSLQSVFWSREGKEEN